MYFDTHAHYDSSRFEEDRAALLATFPESGVDGVVNCGCDLPSSFKSVQLSEAYPFIWAAVGTHPDDADHVTPEVLDEYRRLAAHPRVVAIGEIGLDYHYPDNPAREVQIAAFRQQLELAIELNKPVIVHVRDATEDALSVVRDYKGKVRGVFHCFAGSVETARELLKMGWYLGFTGVLTFKNAKKAAQVVEYAPLSRLFLETDCPYMAPEPHRGKRCDSRMLSSTCARMAEIKGLPVEEVARITQENARTFFGI